MGLSTQAEQEQQLAEKVIGIRRHLHQFPELSDEEYETTAFIKRLLQEAGIKVVDYGLETGVIAEIGNSAAAGSLIALRADIDALPIQEETGLPYASAVAGKMHACGHDFHTASIIGAALLLKAGESELAGTVRIIFQPSEEKAKGARKVIASGALDGVQAIFGMHNKPDLALNTIGIKPGPIMAAADGFVVEVDGVGAHAAVPEAGIDPIVVAAHIVTAVQAIVSRNVGMQQQAVISITKLHSGTAWNVIPDQAILEGTIRTFDSAVRHKVLERFQQVVSNVAAAFATSAKVRWIEGPPPVLNDASLAQLGQAAARQAGLEHVAALPSPAGEDFAYYQQHVPGLFVFFGTGQSKEWHHPQFDIDELALLPAAQYFARLAELALDTFASKKE